jgi:hypothetical protein
MFRHHLPHDRCNIVVVKVVITPDIAQSVLKNERHLSFYKGLRILGVFYEGAVQEFAISISLVLF